MSARAQVVQLIAVCGLCLFGYASAADSAATISGVFLRAVPSEVAGALATLAGDQRGSETVIDDVDPALLVALQQRRISLVLVAADAAARRQALAHALGAWHARRADGSTLYSRAATLPLHTLHARVVPSTLVDRRELPSLVRGLLAPWLADGSAGIDYVERDGQWSAALDGPGNARLIEVLDLLMRPRPQAPPAIPDPWPATAASTVTPGGHALTTWSDTMLALATAFSLSVSLGPGFDPDAQGPWRSLPSGDLAQLLRLLGQAGCSASIYRGVLCLDAAPAPIRDAEHPGQRARLCLAPVPHLLREDARGLDDLAALCRELRTTVAPTAWTLPGYGLAALPEARALLIAGDPDLIHAVLDALDAREGGR